MIKYPSTDRLSAKEASSNEWLLSKQMHNIELETANVISENAKNYKVNIINILQVKRDLKETILFNISMLYGGKEEKEKLQDEFMKFDIDKNGKLSKGGIVQVYNSIYNDNTKAESEGNLIIKNADINCDEFLDFAGI